MCNLCRDPLLRYYDGRKKYLPMLIDSPHDIPFGAWPKVFKKRDYGADAIFHAFLDLAKVIEQTEFF